MPAVTLCVINHDGAGHLPHAFAALARQAFHFAEVLVVDNASTDGSADAVLGLWPAARVLRLDRNRGPGAARNAGFTASRSDLILFQDNDVRLDVGTAGLLLDDLIAHPGTLAVAPRVLYADDPARVQFDSADCHFLGLMATRNADAIAAESDPVACDTTSLVTACFLFDRRAWLDGAPREAPSGRGRAAPFDETLGFNLEDHDFGVRACVAGHRLRVQPRARVLHGGGTPGLSYRPGRRPAEARQFYLTRNRWVVVAKCFAPRTLLVLAPALLVFELLQLAWLVAQGRAGVWFRALASAWRARREIRASRALVQRGRRVPDGRVLRDAPLPMTRHVRGHGAVARVAPVADRAFRTYWRLAARWVEGR